MLLAERRANALRRDGLLERLVGQFGAATTDYSQHRSRSSLTGTVSPKATSDTGGDSDEHKSSQELTSSGSYIIRSLMAPDERHWLWDAAQVAELLIGSTKSSSLSPERTQQSSGGNGSGSGSNDSPGAAQFDGQLKRLEQHFALGAQLDADESLSWLVNSRSGVWPKQVCRSRHSRDKGRLCGPQRLTGGGADCAAQETSPDPATTSTTMSGHDSSSKDYDQVDYDQSAGMESGSFEFDDDQDASLRWDATHLGRGLVLFGHLLCVSADLILIGTLFRVRKSRVSMACWRFFRNRL